MGQAESFEWSRPKNGDVVISHHGRVATTLRGRRADQFIEDVTLIGTTEPDRAFTRSGTARLRAIGRSATCG